MQKTASSLDQRFETAQEKLLETLYGTRKVTGGPRTTFLCSQPGISQDHLCPWDALGLLSPGCCRGNPEIIFWDEGLLLIISPVGRGQSQAGGRERSRGRGCGS